MVKKPPVSACTNTPVSAWARDPAWSMRLDCPLASTVMTARTVSVPPMAS
jgi:hypothetical protein